MKPELLFTLLLSLFLSHCKNSETTVYLKAESVDGIQPEVRVTLNGAKIGEVDEVLLSTKGEPFIKLALDQEAEIPTDSKFAIVSTDYFGSKEIKVRFGESNKSINNGDTIVVTRDKSLVLDDTIMPLLKDFVENLNQGDQCDSLLHELRQLNQNLQKLDASSCSTSQCIKLGNGEIKLPPSWVLSTSQCTGSDFTTYCLVSPDLDSALIYFGRHPNISDEIKMRTEHYLKENFFDTAWVNKVNNEFRLARLNGVHKLTKANRGEWDPSTQEIVPPKTDSLQLLIADNEIASIWGLGPLPGDTTSTDYLIEMKGEDYPLKIHVLGGELDHVKFEELFVILKSTKRSKSTD